MAISPFSIEHDWSIHWRRLPSNFKETPILGQIAENEKEAINAVASIGLITASQLFNIYSLSRNKVKRMVERQRLVEHQLVMNNKNKISIYSLGINGAKIAGVVGYENNYWVKYRITDILRRLLFFNFYERFYPYKINPTIDPFVGSISINNKTMFVYVLRDNLSDISMYLKWNKLNERLIIITESLKHLEELKPFLHDIKLRVILDEGVMNKEQSINEQFYMLKENEFVKEN